MRTPINPSRRDEQAMKRYSFDAAPDNDHGTDRAVLGEHAPVVDRYAPQADSSYATSATGQQPTAVPVRETVVKEPVVAPPARTHDQAAADLGIDPDAVTGSAETVGLVGAILLLVLLFVAYYSGGYVAARMARFNGVKQGPAVSLWALSLQSSCSSWSRARAASTTS